MAMTTEQLAELVRGLGQVVTAAVQQQQQDGTGGGGRGGVAADQRAGKARLNVRGWENLEIFKGGEESWSPWSWKVEVATGAMDGGIKKLMDLAEGKAGRTAEEILEEVDALEKNTTTEKA